jgi:hypothetical protein
MLKSLAALTVAIAAAVVPAQAQDEPSTAYQAPAAPYGQPPYGTQNAPGSNYGYGYNYGYGNFEFDRSLLAAVNACANRASRSNLGRITVNEVDRTTYNRFLVRGTTNSYGYYGQGTTQYPYGYNYPYPQYGRSFTCTADAYGRVISWDVQRR